MTMKVKIFAEQKICCMTHAEFRIQLIMEFKCYNQDLREKQQNRSTRIESSGETWGLGGGVGRSYLGSPPAGSGCRQVWGCRRNGREWTWPSGWWKDPDNVCLWTGFGQFLDMPVDRKVATPCSGNWAPTPPDAASHSKWMVIKIWILW